MDRKHQYSVPLIAATSTSKGDILERFININCPCCVNGAGQRFSYALVAKGEEAGISSNSWHSDQENKEGFSSSEICTALMGP